MYECVCSKYLNDVTFSPVADEHGHVRISDLGLACDFSKKKPHASVGTHGYMAPEVLSKGTAYDSSADWFSFGCMLYKLLKGHSPFRQHKTKDKHEIDRMTLTMNVELPDTFSQELRNLLEELLQVRNLRASAEIPHTRKSLNANPGRAVGVANGTPDLMIGLVIFAVATCAVWRVIISVASGRCLPRQTAAASSSLNMECLLSKGIASIGNTSYCCASLALLVLLLCTSRSSDFSSHREAAAANVVLWAGKRS